MFLGSAEVLDNPYVKKNKKQFKKTKKAIHWQFFCFFAVSFIHLLCLLFWTVCFHFFKATVSSLSLNFRWQGKKYAFFILFSKLALVHLCFTTYYHTIQNFTFYPFLLIQRNALPVLLQQVTTKKPTLKKFETTATLSPLHFLLAQ